MNEPPTTHILLPHEALFGFACTCLKAVGVPSAHAELVSRLLVESDLRGVRSHGTRQVNRYCLELQQGGLNPDPQVTHLSDHGAVVALDGDGGLGYLPMVRATEIAIERAGQFGLGLTTVRNIGHYGAAGNYCRRCTEAGCIGFSVQGVEGLGNAGGQIPKPQLAFFGNPPICFAFPGREGPGVVLDAATRILGDDQLGPEFAALVPQIPGAFFRSVGLTAVAELLGAGLAGAMLRPATARQCWPAAVWGAWSWPSGSRPRWTKTPSVPRWTGWGAMWGPRTSPFRARSGPCCPEPWRPNAVSVIAGTASPLAPQSRKRSGRSASAWACRCRGRDETARGRRWLTGARGPEQAGSSNRGGARPRRCCRSGRHGAACGTVWRRPWSVSQPLGRDSAGRGPLCGP